MPSSKLVIMAVATTAAVGLATAPALGARSVSVKDNSFSPRSLSVKRGSTVKFTWRGSNPHNVTGSGAARFRSRTQTRGSYRTPKLRRKGTVRVVCTIHAGMRMRIRVR